MSVVAGAILAAAHEERPKTIETGAFSLPRPAGWYWSGSLRCSMCYFGTSSDLYFCIKVASGACQVFGLVTHFFYLAFFAWTGFKIQRILQIYFLLQASRRISSTVPLSPSLIQTGFLLSCITRCVFMFPNISSIYFYNGDLNIFCRLAMLHPL